MKYDIHGYENNEVAFMCTKSSNVMNNKEVSRISIFYD